MNPWELIGTMLGWILFALLVAAAFGIVVLIALGIIAGVQVAVERNRKTPDPVPTPLSDQERLQQARAERIEQEIRANRGLSLPPPNDPRLH